MENQKPITRLKGDRPEKRDNDGKDSNAFI